MKTVVLVLCTCLPLAAATSALASSGDYYENTQVTDPWQWDGQQPASILLIQDQPGWGFNSHVQILSSCGIPYNIINSSQIAAHNFDGYDKIVTAGQQPPNFYLAIEENAAKFEDWLNEVIGDNCVAFETASYFGDYNELITWPFGFRVQIDPANSITIESTDNCLLDGVTLEELQGWNYSAHGMHTDLPAGYISCLGTNDAAVNGSCAGGFPWGSGGVYVANQPLEWAYAGYSQTYPRNFDCCEYSIVPPTGVKETPWGSVKALFR
jgi:hypothetical protein